MAKRRGGGGGGSGIGLVITLIFFIVLSLGEGVAIYIVASPREDVVKLEKEAEANLSKDTVGGGAAEVKELKSKQQSLVVGLDKLREAQRERDWYRFQAMVYREYMGYPNKVADETVRTSLANSKEEFGRLGNVEKNFGPKPLGADDVKKVIESLDNELDLKWNAPAAGKAGGDLQPSKTFQMRLKEKDAEIKKAVDAAEKLQKDLVKAQEERDEKDARLTQAQKTFEKGIKDAQTAAKKTSDEDREQLDRVRKSLDKVSVEKADAAKKAGDAELKKAELEGTLKLKEADLAAAAKERNDAQDALKAAKARVDELRARLKEDEKTLADRALDVEALRILQRWPQDKLRWKIIQLDRQGSRPYINLGSADGLEPGITFSVHAMGRDGKLTPLPKGTIEVTELIRNESHLARVRVTSVTDQNNDPIVAGDHLFNPTFSPGTPKRVAIAGVADLGGEGTDSSADFRRLLERQGVVIDAYVDTKDAKEPRLLKGGRSDDKEAKGEVTAKTTYLIVADGFDVLSKHPSKNDKEYAKKFQDLVSEMQDKARNNGVTVLSLQRYLDMIGYKPPKAIATKAR